MRSATGLGVFFILCFLLPAGCSSSKSVQPTGAPNLRVRLLAAQDQVLMTASAPPRVRMQNEPKPRPLQFPLGQQVQVILAGDGWRVGGVPLGGGELIVEQESDGTVAINGIAYRGRFRFVPVGLGKFDLINDIDIDTYLKGVIAAEMFARWEYEAFRAQAIVARTYALYQANTLGITRHFDVEDSTADQVYKGLTKESDKAAQAVDSTAGIVVTAGAGNGKIFKAYFSACCGGISQSSYDAFGDNFNEVLIERNVGSNCNASPKFNWGPVEMRKDELTRRMKSWGAGKNHPLKDMAMLDRIDIQYVNRFGRPVRFLVTDINGQRYTLSSEETRWSCNADAKDGTKLNSSFFKTIITPQTVQFVDGHGYGHGVGMCQWCAQSWAEKGQSAEYIVTQSFPRAQLKRAY